jgi:CBS domain-containing protein
MTVAAILKTKGRTIVAARPTDTIADVARQLAEHHIGAVVVRDAVGQLVGIISERDIVMALPVHGAEVLDMTAAQLMTRELGTATLRTTEAEALAMMTTGRFRHLPVMEHGEMVGLISIGDVVKARIMQQDAEVETMRAYVSGAA